jgi:hypothetical protein
MSEVQLPNRAGEVLSVIADALTRQPANHALEHLPSLRARTRRLHNDFVSVLDKADALVTDWGRALRDDEVVVDAFKRPGSSQEPFRRIAPIIVSNFQRVARALTKETTPSAPATTVDELSKVVARFEDFINLGSVVRQYTDSVVETSYQLGNLDAAKFNYKFLESLVSFAPVAPVSLHQTLYSDALQAAVSEFAAMTGGQRRDSAFSRDEHAQFGRRVAWLKERLGTTDRLEQSLNKIFKFCSDFVHLGYASSVALGPVSTPQIVMGAGDLFTAPTLNYAELRVRLLGECARYYAEIFAPTLVYAFEAMLVDADDFVVRARELTELLSVTRHYVAGVMAIEFIKDGLIESDQSIQIECGFCETTLKWQAPHHVWDCYCEGCGKQFQADVVPEAVDYIVSSEGFSKVNGSDAPEIDALSVPLREKLDAIRQRHVPAREGEPLPYVSVTDLERVEVETLNVPSICTSRPGPEYDGQYPVIAYAASKALARQIEVAIHCNCGAQVIYAPATGSNVCRCKACQTLIGIFGISGNATEMPVLDGPGGPRRLVPIHGARSTRLRNDGVKGP